MCNLSTGEEGLVIATQARATQELSMQQQRVGQPTSARQPSKEAKTAAVVKQQGEERAAPGGSYLTISKEVERDLTRFCAPLTVKI